MQNVFENIKERLEERKNKLVDYANQSNFDGWEQEEKEYLVKADECEKLIEIVNQVAEEYSNSEIPNNSDRWIPCNERMPEEHMDKELHMASDLVQVTMIDEDGNSYVLDDCTLDGEWCNAGDLFEVIAWQPLPAPYPPKGE